MNDFCKMLEISKLIDSAEYKLAHDKIDSFYDQKEFDIIFTYLTLVRWRH